MAERVARDGGARGEAALDHLAGHDPYDKDTWTKRAAADGSIATLRALGPDTTADLLEHAYYLAMHGLHVLLWYPLLEPPTPGGVRGPDESQSVTFRTAPGHSGAFARTATACSPAHRRQAS